MVGTFPLVSRLAISQRFSDRADEYMVPVRYRQQMVFLVHVTTLLFTLTPSIIISNYFHPLTFPKLFLAIITLLAHRLGVRFN
jgi:hypothetical protein